MSYWKRVDGQETILVLAVLGWGLFIGPALLFAADRAGIDWRGDGLLFRIFVGAYLFVFFVLSAAFLRRFVTRIIREGGQGPLALVASVVWIVLVLLLSVALRALFP